MVLPADDLLPPGAVVQIPADGLDDAVCEFCLRQPAKLSVDLCGVDGIAHIMALAVCDVSDEAFGLAKLSTDEPDDVDVAHFVVAADVVDLAGFAASEDKVDGPAVILHVEPIPHVEALAVDGQGFVIEGVGDHQGDELFRELVGAVVVGTATDGHGQAVGAVVGHHQEVGAGLGGAVRGACMDRCFLRKEQVRPVQGQVAVDLVGGDLVEALHTVLPAGIHQNLGAENVGLQEDTGILNAAVNMGFRREVDNDVGLLLCEETVHRRPVTDVRPDEAEVRLVHDGRQGRYVPRVGELVQADDAPAGMDLEHMEDEVGADKPGPAGDDDGHGSSLLAE